MKNSSWEAEWDQAFKQAKKEAKVAYDHEGFYYKQIAKRLSAEIIEKALKQGPPGEYSGPWVPSFKQALEAELAEKMDLIILGQQ